MTGIEVSDLTKTYRGALKPALQNVSLSVSPGDVCGIIGPNGAGKTTLMGCLLGFLFPNSGTVTIDGLSPNDRDVRSRTGFLPERLVMDRVMTGTEFLLYHHELARLPSGSRRSDVVAALERVGLAGEAAARRVARYSRGMLQRLGLAQALLGNPRYLFLDEPTSGIDPSGVVLFRRLVEEQRRLGTTVILNSHQLDQVERVCTRIIFVKEGRVESMGIQQAGAAHSCDLHIRMAAGTPEDIIERALRVPLPAGTRFERRDDTVLIFSVQSDPAAAALLRMLISADLPVVQAMPGEGRLERLFDQTANRHEIQGEPAPSQPDKTP